MTAQRSRAARPSPRRATDDELCALCREDDADAWAELLRRKRRLIYSVPLRMGIDPEDAGDVFQEVSLILYRKLGTLRDTVTLDAWILTTAYRHCLRFLRSRREELVPAAGEDSLPAWDGAPAPESLPEEEIERALLSEKLRAAVDELPDKCRGILTLLFFDPTEPDYDEISRRLGIPRGSLGPFRARCLDRLRKLFPADAAGE